MGILGSFFGDAKQESHTSSSTTEIDSSMAFNRDVGTVNAATQSGTRNKNYGAGAVTNDLELNGSNNVVTLSDYGSVSKAIDLVAKGVEQFGKSAQQTQSQASDLLSGVLASSSKQNEQLASEVAALKTSDVRVLVIGALAIVAAVVTITMKKGG